MNNSRDIAYLQTLGFPFVGTLLDGVQVGSFAPMLARTINTADTTLPHKLGRKPQGYQVVRNRVGGVVYDGTNFGTDWTDIQIVLRATVAGVYGLIIF